MATDAPASRSPAHRIIRPLKDFLATQAAGGLLLVFAAAVALIWANSPWSSSYDELWSTRVGLSFGDASFVLSLGAWVSEGLMTLFFLVVGLEIKRELVEGELNERGRAALPAFAAIGGMVVPAALYALINVDGNLRGWGVPMATDIAVALGALSLLGSRLPASAKLFLLAFAIVDDIGAILVIALFYSSGIGLGSLAIAAAAVLATVAMRRLGVRSIVPYTVIGVVLWTALHEAGIHPTLAGVTLGLLAPTRPLTPVGLIDETALADLSTLAAAEQTVRLARSSVSIVEWLEHRLNPWTSYVIVPLFALANAGVGLDASDVRAASSSPITFGIVVGLVIGKLVGISAGAYLAVRSGLSSLPPGLTWPMVRGVAALGGIGFTVSLFVTDLAFIDEALRNEAKIGVVVASVLAAAVGFILLRRAPGEADDEGLTQA